MNLQLNGVQVAVEDSIKTVEDLLRERGLLKQPIAVEHNGKALFPQQFQEALLEEGSQIEVVIIAAGG